MVSPLGRLLNHCRILVVGGEYFIANDLANQGFGKLGADVIGPASDQEKALDLLASV